MGVHVSKRDKRELVRHESGPERGVGKTSDTRPDPVHTSEKEK